MPEVNQPEDLGRLLAEIERRLRTLETSQRASNTSITDEDGNELVRFDRDGIKIYDATGVLRARFGYINVASGYGVSVWDENAGLRFEVNDDGYRDPWLPHPMISAGVSTNVTGGSFAAIYQGQVQLVTHKGVSLTAVVSTDVGTVGEVRLKNIDTGATTSVVSIGSGSSIEQGFNWLHGSLLGGGPVRFDLEARRVSGAGNVIVYQPYTLAMADPGSCTATGL